MAQPDAARYDLPLFKEYSFNELSFLTGISIPHLHKFAIGEIPPSKRLRRRAVEVLNRSETDLFGPALEVAEAVEAD